MFAYKRDGMEMPISPVVIVEGRKEDLVSLWSLRLCQQSVGPVKSGYPSSRLACRL